MLYKHYEDKTILPTYAGFKSHEDFFEYKLKREAFFINRCSLLPSVFKNSELIEFGPDSGENALVFASWGANMTLVEPNKLAHSYIKDYFEKFKLGHKLRELRSDILEKFSTNKKYDVVIAEGFIYTVRPISIWKGLFYDILKSNGIFIISYYESFGTLFELLFRAIYSVLTKEIKGDKLDIAWRIFENKWESIYHTRTFDAWVMDVLENPFVRLKYFIDSTKLCDQFINEGFSLYASCPNYKDLLQVQWHKSDYSFTYEKKNAIENIKRARLGFMMGEKVYSSSSMELIEELNDFLLLLVKNIDSMIDDCTSKVIQNSIFNIEQINKIILELDFIAKDGIKKDVYSIFDMLKEILSMLKNKNYYELITFCNKNNSFIKCWGMPTHFAVFRKIDSINKEDK